MDRRLEIAIGISDALGSQRDTLISTIATVGLVDRSCLTTVVQSTLIPAGIAQQVKHLKSEAHKLEGRSSSPMCRVHFLIYFALVRVERL